MKKVVLFELETPYREPAVVEGFVFGDPDGKKSAAVVGSLRGNEIQQTYVCARLVRRLAVMERDGLIHKGESILVLPHANGFSMNIEKRFWPHDNTDINRMFPGYDAGETTQRMAAGIFEAVKDYAYGIQMCSYYLPGDFFPHTRVIRTNEISDESLALADSFGLPYVVEKDPAPFDTGTLNFNWQVWGCHAFSLYSHDDGRVDQTVATYMQDCILRFLAARGIVDFHAIGGYIATHVRERDLVDVRAEKAGGFFNKLVDVGRRVEKGEPLAEVLDSQDCHVKDTLVSPTAGYIFFSHLGSLINQYTIAFKIVAE